MQPWGTLRVVLEDQILTRGLTAAKYRLGREEGAEMHLAQGWVSRRQASIARYPGGALVTNLSSYKMRVTSKVLDSTAGRGGAVGIGVGDTVELAWPGMPHPLTASLTLPWPAGITGHHLPKGKGAGTLLPSPYWILDAKPEVRNRMAVLFRHLLCGEERPSKLYETAADELGVSPEALKQTVHRLRVQASRRGQQFADVDALGRYLVESQLLTKADLDRSGGV